MPALNITFQQDSANIDRGKNCLATKCMNAKRVTHADSLIQPLRVRERSVTGGTINNSLSPPLQLSARS